MDRKGNILASQPFWSLFDVDLKGALDELHGWAVVVENDAKLAALGERWRGSAAGIDDLVVLLASERFIMLNPELVVIGGEVADSASVLLESVAHKVAIEPAGAAPADSQVPMTRQVPLDMSAPDLLRIHRVQYAAIY